MNWSKDSLFSKAKIYFAKAEGEERDSTFFGMYCALGLELLARAALANISPTLLADPNPNQISLLYALGLKDDTCKPKSIMTNRVIALCGELIPDFDTDMQKIATLMTERRNEELHTGGGGFAEYGIDNWIAGFYKVCQVLVTSIGESLDTLFGRETAKVAEEIINQDTEKLKKEVLDKINARRKTYEEDQKNNPEEVAELIERSNKIVAEKTYRGYHHVTCPCCGNDALIYGKENISSHDVIDEDEVVVKKDVTASQFQCEVCKLRLSSYAELKIANLPLHYTNTYHFNPIDYFDIDIESLREADYYEGYSNE